MEEDYLTPLECTLVRETMLRQEKIYREQVQALHCLYEVQKTLMDQLGQKQEPVLLDLNSALESQDYQFFPPKQEVKKTVRGFDLEKLPDESFEEELQQKAPLPNGYADVDLVLHSQGHVSKRARYEGPNVEYEQRADKGRALENQPHWLLEESKKRERLHNPGYFIPANSWLQISHSPQTGFYDALYGQMQPAAAHSHPWHLPAAAYYSSYPCTFGNNQVYRNGNMYLDQLFARGSTYTLGAHNFYTETARTSVPAQEMKQDVDVSQDVTNLAASILVSLKLDDSTSREMDPTGLAWLADTLPSEGCCDESLDSLESAILELKPSEAEEVVVQRQHEEATECSQKTKMMNSGRPARMCKKQRDFRTDTLPSIISLSRQEITEDWQIMSGLVRSCRENTLDSCKRGGKFCSISRMDSAKSSPVSTLDVAQCGSPLKKSKEEDGLPWLVSWGECTRRKRQRRLRSASAHKLKLFAANTNGRR